MSRKVKLSINKKILDNIKGNTEENLNKGVNILMKYKTRQDFQRKQRLSNTSNLEETANKHFKNIIFVIISFVLFIILYFFIQYSPILGLNIFSGVNDEEIIIENINSSECLYYNYDNELLTYQNGVIETYNKSSRKTWEYKIEEKFSPYIYINGSYMAVVNKINGTIYMFSGKREIANKKIDGIINDIYIDEYGNIAAEYSTSGYKKVISVMDKYGKVKYTLHINTSSILDIKVLNKGKKLIIIQSDSDSLTVGTKISMIDIDKSNEIQELTILKNKLVYSSKVVNNDLILLCNDEVIKLNISNKNINSVHNLDMNQTNYITLSNTYFTAIETKEKGYLYVTSKFDNTNISTSLVSVFPKYIRSSEYITYIICENSIIIMNKWGVVLKEINIKFAPKDLVIINNGKSAALIYNSKIQIVNL